MRLALLSGGVDLIAAAEAAERDAMRRRRRKSIRDLIPARALRSPP
jgi:hypothetical protein